MSEPVLLRGGSVWTGSAFEQRDILVDEGAVKRLRVPEDGVASTRARTVDCADSFVIPGLCNAHSHSHNVIARGMLQTQSLEVLISNNAAANVSRTPEEMHAAATLNGIEVLRTGGTAVCDLFTALPPSLEHIEAVVLAYESLGLRALVGVQYTELPFHPTVPGLMAAIPAELREAVEKLPTGRPDLAIFREAAKRWQGTARGRIGFALAPTIPMLCSDQLLQDTVALSTEFDLPLFTHLAESKLETIASLDRYGESVVAYLERIGFLTPRTVLAHAVWISHDDISRVAASGAIVAHAPASNLRLGSGIAPVRELLAAGVPVVLGTDGSVSSDNQNMFEAMKFAALVSRVRTFDQSAWITPNEAFTMATETSRRISGFGPDVGRITEGARADLVLIRKSSVYLHPPIDTLENLVLAEPGSGVASVMIDGKFVYENGTSTQVSESAALMAIDEAAERMLVRNNREWGVARALAPYVMECCMRASTDLPWRHDKQQPANERLLPIP